jgi:hypothetical protein
MTWATSAATPIKALRASSCGSILRSTGWLWQFDTASKSRGKFRSAGGCAKQQAEAGSNICRASSFQDDLRQICRFLATGPFRLRVLMVASSCNQNEAPHGSFQRGFFATLVRLRDSADSLLHILRQSVRIAAQRVGQQRLLATRLCRCNPLAF